MIDAVKELHREAGLGSGELRLEVGERVFVMVEMEDMTLEHHSAIQAANEQAGFGMEMIQAYQPVYEDQLRNGGIDTSAAERITYNVMMKAHQKGVVPDFLAAVMVEKDKEWSPESAQQNRELFAKLKGPKVIAQVNAIMSTMALAFFVSGLRSAAISLSSSQLHEQLAALGLETEPTISLTNVQDGGADSVN